MHFLNQTWLLTLCACGLDPAPLERHGDGPSRARFTSLIVSRCIPAMGAPPSTLYRARRSVFWKVLSDIQRFRDDVIIVNTVYSHHHGLWYICSTEGDSTQALQYLTQGKHCQWEDHMIIYELLGKAAITFVRNVCVILMNGHLLKIAQQRNHWVYYCIYAFPMR